MKSMKIFAGTVIAMMTVSVSLSAQETIPQFHKGEKVVLMGDSITHGGHYHSFIWLFYMTRFPEMRIDMVNAGMGGECSWDMVQRLDADIFQRNPTYVTLTFGMNDTGYQDVYNTPGGIERSAASVKKSLDSFHEIESRLAASKDFETVMIGGSPYDETSKFNKHTITGKNDAMRKIIADQKRAAQEHGWGFVDFHEPMIEISRREQAKDSTFTFCRLERVHPDNDGQMVMAYLFLKAQGLAGKKVADVQMTAKGKVRKSENCSITNVSHKDGKLSFDYLANSLPYPTDSISQNGWANKRSQRDALQLVPFTEEFNQELLAVSGLSEGRYSISIDGQKITEVTAEQLGEGINLATYTNTPQYHQASTVMYLNEERLMMERRLVEYLWVEYEYLRKAGLEFKDNEECLDYLREICKHDFFLGISYSWYKQAMDPAVRETWADYQKTLTDKIYSINKPITRKFVIEKVYQD